MYLYYARLNSIRANAQKTPFRQGLFDIEGYGLVWSPEPFHKWHVKARLRLALRGAWRAGHGRRKDRFDLREAVDHAFHLSFAVDVHPTARPRSALDRSSWLFVSRGPERVDRADAGFSWREQDPCRRDPGVGRRSIYNLLERHNGKSRTAIPTDALTATAAIVYYDHKVLPHVVRSSLRLEL